VPDQNDNGTLRKVDCLLDSRGLGNKNGKRVFAKTVLDSVEAVIELFSKAPKFPKASIA